MQKNNSAQVGQNFQNQVTDKLSGIKNGLPTKLVGSPKLNFCPGWAEVKKSLLRNLHRSYKEVIAQKENRCKFHPNKNENCSGQIISLEMSASDPDQPLQWSKEHHHAV